MSSTPKVSRRKFLVASTAATAGAATFGAQGCGPMMPSGPTDVGAVSEWMVDQTRVPTMLSGVIVGRDAGGFYAYTRTCTHQACLIPAPTGGSSLCPCHNSTYNQNGDLTRPAPGASNQTNLAHYAVTFTGMGAAARVLVDTGTVEPNRAARAMPPA